MNRAKITGDFRRDLEAFIGRNAARIRKSGASYTGDMGQDTIDAGVWLNQVQPGITFRAWGFWMAGATLHAYPERVVVVCQSELFKRRARAELGALMQAAYKRPVHFVTR